MSVLLIICVAMIQLLDIDWIIAFNDNGKIEFN